MLCIIINVQDSKVICQVSCKIGYGFAWPTFGRPAFITQNFKIYLLFDQQDVCLYQKLYTLYHNYFVVTIYKTLHVYYQKLRRRKWVCTSHAWMHVVQGLHYINTQAMLSFTTTMYYYYYYYNIYTYVVVYIKQICTNTY